MPEPGNKPYYPGAWERFVLDTRELLRIDKRCSVCNDLCVTEEERKAKLCTYDLDRQNRYDAERPFISPDPDDRPNDSTTP